MANNQFTSESFAVVRAPMDPATGKPFVSCQYALFPGIALAQSEPELVVLLYDSILHQYPDTAMFLYKGYGADPLLNRKYQQRLLTHWRNLGKPTVILATPEDRKFFRGSLAEIPTASLYDILIASARAIGDSVTPLLTLFLSVGLNIAGDILLLGVLHTGVWGAALATVAAQLITAVVCCVYILRRYDFYRYRSGDLQLLERPMMVTMMKTGLSMALMSCLISIGSFVLQTAINGLGNSYIVAQSAARRITEILMSVFVAIGHTMATYCSQNLGADRWDRIHEGMKAGYWITCLWCVLVLVIVYTLAPTLICMITGSSDLVMIHAATQYLRIDSILYVLVAVIFVQRNSMQGIGDTVTPLISSGIEMAGKIILAFTLVPALGYFGVILVEPIVWIVMIIPLILKVRTWER